MKAPLWEPSSGNLVAWLNANTQARPVDLYTIKLVGGTVLRYSGGDVAITVNGNTYTLGPGLARQRVRQSIGVSVDALQLRLLADATVLVGAVPILQSLAAGQWVGATVALDRVFIDAAGTAQGLVGVFYGRVGNVRVARSEAQIEVRSHAELLDVMVPSELYQPGCRNTLFDPQCGLAAATYTVSGTTSAAGDVTRRILTSTTAAVIGKPASWSALGVLTFTSGLNAGLSRTVRTHALAASTATLTLVTGVPYAIAAGDAFTLRAGCDKRFAGDCATKFANQARFRGEPFIPPPETIT